MSATPGPKASLPSTRNGRAAAVPSGNGVAMPHQHDRLVAAAAARQARDQAIAVGRVRHALAGDAFAFEKGAQPFADPIDPRLVVAAGIDVHQFCQQPHHRLVLPPEMLDDRATILAAHAPSSACDPATD